MKMKIDEPIKKGIEEAAKDLNISTGDVIRVALGSFLSWHQGNLLFTQGLVQIFHNSRE